MDATSGQGAASTPNSQFPLQDTLDFFIDDLLKKVDEFQKRQQQNTLDKIITKNLCLELYIAKRRQSCTRKMNLMQDMYTAVTLMQKAFEKYYFKEMKANENWLAFWEYISISIQLLELI
ncbi:hypothetical protein B0O99DRAFT_695316 [Bisporella sp. PMI_857]|nr:hypothetical protein B0O99DRAFT_695316 [Bisporella sp. PMI_857]